MIVGIIVAIALLNSVLLRYKLDKTKYFEDFIFKIMRII